MILIRHTLWPSLTWYIVNNYRRIPKGIWYTYNVEKLLFDEYYVCECTVRYVTNLYYRTNSIIFINMSIMHGEAINIIELYHWRYIIIQNYILRYRVIPSSRTIKHSVDDLN